jgi:hypothetical protein
MSFDRIQRFNPKSATHSDRIQHRNHDPFGGEEAMKKLGPFGDGHSDYDELLRDEDTDVFDDPGWCEPSGGAVDLFEDDDGLGDDVPNVRHTPYCPMDTLDALEFCGRVADDLANGKPVSRAKEVASESPAKPSLLKRERQKNRGSLPSPNSTMRHGLGD